MRIFNINDKKAKVLFMELGDMYNPVIDQEGTHKKIPLLLEADQVEHMKTVLDKLPSTYSNAEYFTMSVAGAARISMGTKAKA